MGTNGKKWIGLMLLVLPMIGGANDTIEQKSILNVEDICWRSIVVQNRNSHAESSFLTAARLLLENILAQEKRKIEFEMSSVKEKMRLETVLLLGIKTDYLSLRSQPASRFDAVHPIILVQGCYAAAIEILEREGITLNHPE